MAFWETVLAGASQLAGPISDYFQGQENRRAVSDANQANRERADSELAMNLKKQEEFAKHGIRWKMEDAQAAGISPLAALGASGASFSPVSSGHQEQPFVSDHISRMGQNISRAASSMVTSEEREIEAMKIQSMQLDLEGKAIDNQIRASQLRQIQSPSPGLPSNSQMPVLTGKGQGNAYVVETPLTRTHSAPGNASQEVGSISDWGYVRTPTGLTIVPSKDVKERIEDQMIPELMWSFRNNFMPNISPERWAPDPKQFPPGEGNKWVWSVPRQEFISVPKNYESNFGVWEKPTRYFKNPLWRR